jgi:prepilin-type N-terminal cleavage/methylation domain-containing protein
MPVSDERGYTLVELLVGMVVSLVVLGAIMAMVQVATGDQNRISEHVIADQRGRPAMNQIIDRLHAACISPGLAPVRPGSDGETLILWSKAGEAVNPVPDQYVISISEGVLSETAAEGSGTEPSDWEFGAVSAPLQIVSGVSGAEVGEPPEAVPAFRYFAYEGGQVATTPLPTPLSKEDAARTVQVDVAFTVAPRAGAVSDPSALVTLTDSATLRIEPASEDSSETNLPCV